jgi:hypothetical protein
MSIERNKHDTLSKRFFFRSERVIDTIKKRKNRRLLLRASFSVFLVLTLVGYQIFSALTTKGATFGWVQSDWSGGADANAVANHNTDQTSWTKYAAKDAAVDLTTSPGDIKIASTPGSATQTTDTDFNAGTKTNVQVGGSGVGGNVGLAPQPQAESGNRWRDMASIPKASGDGSSIVAVNSDTFYATQGNGQTGFSRYSISANTWTTMAATPAGISYGAALVYPGSGDFIYGYRGGSNNKDFYRYTISTDTWTTMAATPGTISSGGALVYPGSGDFIYGYQGGSAAFYRYSISGNSWTTLAVTPAAISQGGSLVYPGSGDYLFGSRGNDSVDFYRYSISGGTWSTMAPAPGDISYDANLVYPGTGDFIYSNRGASRAHFYAYSISSNVWSTKAASPTVVTSGSFLVSPGLGDYLYEKNGNLMFRYSISGNSWNSTPLPFIPGGTLGVFASTGNGYLYIMVGKYWTRNRV